MLLLDKQLVTIFRLYRIARSCTSMFVDVLLVYYLVTTTCAIVNVMANLCVFAAYELGFLNVLQCDGTVFDHIAANHVLEVLHGGTASCLVRIPGYLGSLNISR